MVTKTHILVLIPLVIGWCNYCLGQTKADSSLWSLDLPEVVTTAQPLPTDAKSALHQIRVIQAASLEQRGVTNLEQALQQVAGIRLQQDLVLGSSLQIMGMGGQNVQIMVDGVPVIGRRNGNIDLGQINLDDVLRIEIVEGPLAVSYGTNALAGVINIITRSSQLSPWEWNVQSQLESRSESRISGGVGFQPNDRWLMRAGGGFDRFSGWKTEPDRRNYLWNPKEQWYANAALVFRPTPDQRIRLKGNYFDELVERPGEERRPQYRPYAFDQTFRTVRQDVAATFDGRVGEQSYWQATTAFNQFQRTKDAYRINFEENETITMPDELDTARFSSWMARIQVAFPQKPTTWQVQAGMDTRIDWANGARIVGRNGVLGGTQSIADAAGFFKVGYHGLEQFTFEFGGRYGYNSAYRPPFIPSLHAKWTLNDHWTWRASYGKGFRSPDLKELYFEFIDINHFILGNPDLEAEQADHMQSTLQVDQSDQRGNTWNGQAMVFYNDVRNRITLYEFIETPNGLDIATDTSTFQFAYFNQDRYFSQGIRVGGGVTNDHWRASVQIQTVGMYQPLSEANTDIDRFSYQYSGTGTLSYRWKQPFPVECTAFAHWQDRLISYYPEVDENGQTVSRQREQDGYTQLDLTASATFWQDRLNLTFGARNVLDVQGVGVQGGSGGAHSGSAHLLPLVRVSAIFCERVLPFGKNLRPFILWNFAENPSAFCLAYLCLRALK